MSATSPNNGTPCEQQQRGRHAEDISHATDDGRAEPAACQEDERGDAESHTSYVGGDGVTHGGDERRLAEPEGERHGHDGRHEHDGRADRGSCC